MGNTNSQNDAKLKAKTAAELVDYLASNYITTASFKALKKLNKKEYCDKMVVLTSDILNTYFDTVDISYLANRVKNGDVDKAYFLPEDKINELNSEEKKKDVCMGIAKFYITVAHVFAAIMTTMNPMVEFTDPETNQVRQVSVLEKKEIVPDNVAYEIIHKTSLCDRRIKALKRGHGDVSSDPNQETVNVHPQVCDINRNEQTGETLTLDQEPGIPEFMQLYFDKYNPETGEFDDMTTTAKSTFDEDLKIFYEVFTGNTTMPNFITKFSDIKLRDYHNNPQCRGDDPTLNKHVRGTVSQKLFKQYADNLNDMIYNANKNQEALMDILTQLFGYTLDEQGAKTVRVNSKLTETEMQNIVVKCRELIIKLTLQCEIDFTNGVKIYEAIIESKVFETVQNQIKNIDENILDPNLNVEIPTFTSEAPNSQIPNPVLEPIVGQELPNQVLEPNPEPIVGQELPNPVLEPNPEPIVGQELPNPVLEPNPEPIVGQELPNPEPIVGQELPNPVPIVGQELPNPVPIVGQELPNPEPIVGQELPNPVPNPVQPQEPKL